MGGILTLRRTFGMGGLLAARRPVGAFMPFCVLLSLSAGLSRSRTQSYTRPTAGGMHGTRPMP
eukprot:13511444-Alexandrium_andersonii.AAC.1